MAKSKSVQQQGLYTKADYQLLINERRNLNDLIAIMDKAEQCGVDVSVYRQMRQDIDNQLAAIHTHFMTPAPG